MLKTNPDKPNKLDLLEHLRCSNTFLWELYWTWLSANIPPLEWPYKSRARGVTHWGQSGDNPPRLNQRVEVIPAPVRWAQNVMEKYHYLKRPVNVRAKPFSYGILFDGDIVGAITVGLPHFTKKKGVFGYPGLPTQWQVLILFRFWLHPMVQDRRVLDSKGVEHTLAIGSCALSKMLKRVQRDWLLHRPPRIPKDPYHIRLMLTYADPGFHEGTLYQAANFEYLGMTSSAGPRRTTTRGIRSETEKHIYVFRLSEPRWEAPVIQLNLI